MLRSLMAFCALCILQATTAVAQETSPATEGAASRDVILVPYKSLDAVLQGEAASAVIPLSEYQRYLDGEQSRRDDPPIHLGITRADYVATVEESRARITATLTIRAFTDGWSSLPLSFGDAAVGEVEAGDDVVLVGAGENAPVLLVNGQGEHQVTLHLVARVRTSPEGREFELTVPPVGVSSLEITLPEPDQSVQIQPRAVELPVESPEGQTRVRVNLGATAKATVRWHPRAGTKPAMELLAGVTNHQLVTIDGGYIHHDAWLHYQVLRGSLPSLEIAIPPGHRVLDLSAEPAIRSWTVREEEARQVLAIDLVSPATQTLQVEVHTELPRPDELSPVAGTGNGQAVYGIQALGVARESGQVGVRVGDEYELVIAGQQGLIRLAADQLAPQLAGSPAVFRYDSPKFQLEINAAPVTPRIQVASNSRVLIAAEQLQLATTLDYQIDRAGVFDLVLQIPDDVTVDEVTSAHMREETFDSASRRLTVRLHEKTAGPVQVRIRAHRDLPAGQIDEPILLPVVEPLGVARSTGTVSIFAHPSIQVTTGEEAARSVQPAEVPRATTFHGGQLASAWTWSHQPVRIPFTTKRKPSRLAATVATTIDVQPQATEVETLLDFSVEFAALDTFVILVPESQSGSIQIDAVDDGGSSAPLKQKTPGEPVEGWIPWTLRTQRDVLGTQRFRISTRLPRSPATTEDDADSPPTIEILLPRPGEASVNNQPPVPVSRLRGEVRVLQDKSIALESQATGADIQPIDVRELTQLPAEGALAYRYHTLPDQVGVTVTLHPQRQEIHEVVATIVERALVEITTGRDTDATYRCQYRVKSVERQRLRIDLPTGIKPLGVFVDDHEEQLIRLENAEGTRDDFEAYAVNVSRTTRSGDPFHLTLQFLWEISPRPFTTAYGRGNLRLPLPEIGGREQSAQTQQLAVVAYVPEDIWLVGRPDRFSIPGQRSWWSAVSGRPHPQRFHPEQWMDGTVTTLELPHEGLRAKAFRNLGGADEIEVVWWSSWKMTAIWTAVFILVALLLLKTSCENKVGILLLIIVGLLVLATWDRDVALYGLTASRFGLLALVGLWLVHGLARLTRNPATASTENSAGPYTAPPPDEEAPPHTAPA